MFEATPLEAVRTQFADNSGLPFEQVLPESYVRQVLDEEGCSYRNRIFDPVVTLWGFLSQCLSQDHSCNEVVSRVLAHRAACGQDPCSASSASYCNARKRLPTSVVRRLTIEIGEKLESESLAEWKWHGRSVKMVDGTGLIMPDTPANQSAYPQPKSQQQGLGFPALRAVALISLSTGAVLDFGCAKLQGKQTGEEALFRVMFDSLDSGDVILADGCYGSYFTMALLQMRGVDILTKPRACLTPDFSSGEPLGEQDHAINVPRSKKPKWMPRELYERIPETLTLREFSIKVSDHDGNPKSMVLRTTMTDPATSKEELADLYQQRWQCEVDFRSIKCTMQMDMLRCKTPEMVDKEIWVHLLAYNLLRTVMADAAKKHRVKPRQLSMKGAAQAVQAFTPYMLCSGQKDRKDLYQMLLDAIAQHRIGDRPGRREPRYLKRRKNKYKLMTIPRQRRVR